MKLAGAVLELSEEYPRCGKDKLVVLLRREAFTSSASTTEPSFTRMGKGI